MRKKLLLMALAMATIAISAQEAKEYCFKVGEFSNLEVQNNINVVYNCSPDSVGSAYYTSDYAGDIFLLTLKNDKLKVQLSPDYAGEIPVLKVYSSFLTKVTNDSDGTVIVSSVAPCAEFKAVQIGNGVLDVDGINCTRLVGKISTGNGTVALSGSCSKAELVMVGTGIIQADALKAANVKCRIGGTGAIGCYATEALDIIGMGSTTIYVKGNPSIRKKSLGGKIVKIHSGHEE